MSPWLLLPCFLLLLFQGTHTYILTKMQGACLRVVFLQEAEYNGFVFFIITQTSLSQVIQLNQTYNKCFIMAIYRGLVSKDDVDVLYLMKGLMCVLQWTLSVEKYFFFFPFIKHHSILLSSHFCISMFFF